MDDNALIALYFAREERAATETYQKFGGYCYKIALNILGNPQDAEECVNDVLAKLWNSIPPARPENLYAYIAAVARNIARNRYTYENRQCRSSSEMPLVLDELRDCVSQPDTVEQTLDGRELTAAINTFLGTLKPDHRKIFVQRYWYASPVEDIAADLHMTKSKVTVSLMRTRKKLADYLQKEGLT